MRILRSKKLIALVATVVVAAATAAVGISAVVSRTVLADGEDVTTESIVRIVADDFDSGWVMHHGLVVVQVQQGSLQIAQQGSCTPKTVSAGETFIKTPFTPTRGTSVGRVVFTATFLLTYRDPQSIPVASPCP